MPRICFCSGRASRQLTGEPDHIKTLFVENERLRIPRLPADPEAAEIEDLRAAMIAAIAVDVSDKALATARAANLTVRFSKMRVPDAWPIRPHRLL